MAREPQAAIPRTRPGGNVYVISGVGEATLERFSGRTGACPRRDGSAKASTLSWCRTWRPTARAREGGDGNPSYSTRRRSPAPRPKVSGAYISSAFGGGTTNAPGVVARAT